MLYEEAKEFVPASFIYLNLPSEFTPTSSYYRAVAQGQVIWGLVDYPGEEFDAYRLTPTPVVEPVPADVPA